MPITENRTIVDSVLAKEVLGFTGGPNFARTKMAEVLETLGYRGLDITFVEAFQNGNVVFSVPRGFPPKDLFTIADCLTKRLMHQLDELMPKRRERQLQRVT